MFRVSNKFRLFFICCALSLSTPAQSVEIVRVIFNYEGNNHTVDIELFDDIAPLTVTNYLSYVNLIDADGLPSYQDTFIARSETNFVLQTGGATFRPADPNVNALLENGVPTTGLNAVVSQGTVNNEFNLSNLRGTLAMARKGGQENSATKEWFINLSDDNSFLDGVDGGFTVFGRIVDDGMVTIDEINALPIKIKSNELLSAILPGIFYKLPIANSYVDTDPITTPLFRKDIVMIDSITEINRPILTLSQSIINFADDAINDGLKRTVILTLSNTGDQDLVIDPLAVLASPFSIETENCVGTTLEPVSITPASNCSITFVLETTALGTFNQSFTLSYDTTPAGAMPFTISLNLQGNGIPSAPAVLEVSSTSLNFEDTVLSNTSNPLIVTLQNTGTELLSLNSFLITGLNSDHFSITNNTCDINVDLLANQTCEISIVLNALSTGEKSANLDISSNGGNTSTTLTGSVIVPTIPAVLEVSSTLLNFEDTVLSNTSNPLIVTLQNSGTELLSLNSFLITGLNSDHFSISNTTCDINVDLLTNQTCEISIVLNALSTGEKSANLDISSNGGNTSTTLTGSVVVPTISVDTTNIDIVGQIGSVISSNILVTNIGNGPLVLSNIVFGGANADLFQQVNNCPDTDTTGGASSSIQPNSTCTVQVGFTQTDNSAKTATVTFVSNDPNQPTFDITINGTGGSDRDGVADIIEAAAPNAGDNNNDNVPDNQQSNVASLTTSNNSYITFLSDDSLITNSTTALLGVELISTIPNDIPDSTNFSIGLNRYSITVPLLNGVSEGVAVGILLPIGTNPDRFFKFGPTSDNTTPHWYEFTFDANTRTGAQFLGEVSLPSPTGDTVKRNFVIVNFVDGFRGDDDMTANGIIINNQSGLSFPSSSGSSSSGSMYILPWLCFILISLSRIRKADE